jgi:hypothetical protein
VALGRRGEHLLISAHLEADVRVSSGQPSSEPKEKTREIRTPSFANDKACPKSDRESL